MEKAKNVIVITSHAVRDKPSASVGTTDNIIINHVVVPTETEGFVAL